jgi:hypothetical protein
MVFFRIIIIIIVLKYDASKNKINIFIYFIVFSLKEIHNSKAVIVVLLLWI